MTYTEERRLLSVLFAELTGPAGEGSRLGPEDMRELVGGALAEVVSHVEALGGTVTSLSGSGLVALFGAPEAHEDDPERALRAALGAVVGRLPDGVSVRAGVEERPGRGRAPAGPKGEPLRGNRRGRRGSSSVAICGEASLRPGRAGDTKGDRGDLPAGAQRGGDHGLWHKAGGGHVP